MERPLRSLRCDQLRQLDRVAMDELGMSGLVLMENAGRGIADVLCSQPGGGSAVICCGRGNNAGDGFVIARHLELRGWKVEVVCWIPPDQLQGDARVNYELLQHTDVPQWLVEQASGPELLERFCDRYRDMAWAVDALLGTGARGAPRPPLDVAICAMNQLPARRLAVDIPSGLDADQGHPSDPTLRADVTCTLVAPKPGIVVPAAQPYVGQLHCVDIGVPRRLLARFGL